MSRDRVKKLFETSDWKIWIAAGAGVIALITFIQDAVIEHRVQQARLAVMTSIDREEQAIRESRHEADRRDQNIDAAFEKAMHSSQEIIHSSKNAMNGVRHNMDMDKGK